MQLRLNQSFNPLPQGAGQYVAALQNRKGELEALGNASLETWSRLTPLVQVVGPKKAEPLKGPTVRTWVKRVASAVGNHPCFLDILRLKPTQPTHTSAGEEAVLACLYKAARKLGLQFVPVLPVGDSSRKHLGLVHDAALEDGRGLALRYSGLGAVPPPGSTEADLLSDTLSALRAETTDVDLLFDLGYLSSDTEIHPDDLATLIDEVAEVGPWRNLVLLGTSMPATLSCIPEGEVGRLPRLEWELWSTLWGQPLKRLPSYGDYAVQHPKPPQEGGQGMRANIRYTTKNATLVARGRGPIHEEGNQQYRELCRQLVRQEEFAGASYSWGDQIIQNCADGLMKPGAQALWRGAGTSHHLRLATEQGAFKWSAQLPRRVRKILDSTRRFRGCLSI